MKNTHWIILIIHFILIGFLSIIGLLFRDVVFVYLLILIPGLIFANFEYLFKRNYSYFLFLKDQLLKYFIILIFFLGFIIYCICPRYISKEKAVENIEFMKKTLENIHPDIYYAIPKDSFLIAYNQLISDLPERLSENDFYKICARLTSHFHTGHTRPMSNLSLSRMQFIFNRLFPYQTKILDNRLFITSSLSIFHTIPVGSEIIEINGKNINLLISEWSQLVSYENIAFRNYLITKPLNIGIWNDFKEYNIKYKEYGSNIIKQKIVQGDLFTNLYSLLIQRYEKPEKLVFKEISPKIGYIGFFAFMDLKNYKDFYKAAFGELRKKGIHNLIIDIRGNEGGHTEIGAELMQYIFHQPFKETDSAQVKVSEELIATGKVERKLGVDKKVAGKTYTKVNVPYQLNENPLRFNGQTYLLTDNGTFSAGHVFASAFRCYGNGTIIGEETGGVTVSFGDVHIFDLPNSGLQIMTSWEKVFCVCGLDNRTGVIPDYNVIHTVKDFTINRDKILEFAVNLI